MSKPQEFAAKTIAEARALAALRGIDGVLAVRYLPQP